MPLNMNRAVALQLTISWKSCINTIVQYLTQSYVKSASIFLGNRMIQKHQIFNIILINNLIVIFHIY